MSVRTEGPPKWPYSLNVQDPLSKGLVGWWPIFNQPNKEPYISGSTVTPQFANLVDNNATGIVGALGRGYLTPAAGSAVSQCVHGTDPVWGAWCLEGTLNSNASMMQTEGDSARYWDYWESADGNVFTFLVWVYITSVSTRGWIFGMDSQFNDGMGVYWEPGSGGVFKAYAGEWNVDSELSGWASGQWLRVGLFGRWNSGSWGQARCIVNGTVGSETSVDPLVVASQEVWLGSSGTSRCFTGFMGNACIWNRELSVQELRRDHDPRTRWSLFKTRRKRLIAKAPAAGPGGNDGAAMYHHLQNLGAY